MPQSQPSTDSAVFVVEGQAIYRLGLKHFLECEMGLEVLDESEMFRGAAARILDSAPELVICEMSLPDGNGLELIKELRSSGFAGRILILSSQDESIYAERALRAGANGYVMKAESPDAILGAVHAVLGGDVYVSETMNARLLRRMTGNIGDPARSTTDRLTDREVQVLELIGEGLMTRDIAERLSISSKTVDTHRINIRQKLGIPDVNELIRFAVHWLQSGPKENQS